jgi:hypothetical protein
VAPHWCVVVLQAVPATQSPDVLQPHDELDKHAVPVDEPVQLVQVAPVVPHAALAVPIVH